VASMHTDCPRVLGSWQDNEAHLCLVASLGLRHLEFETLVGGWFPLLPSMEGTAIHDVTFLVS
jgi:hypothetical protein